MNSIRPILARRTLSDLEIFLNLLPIAFFGMIGIAMTLGSIPVIVQIPA